MHRYVISVEGTIPRGALSGLDGLTATSQPLHTVLHGELRDQSMLASVLSYLDELGVVILDVLSLPAASSRLAAPLPQLDAGDLG